MVNRVGERIEDDKSCQAAAVSWFMAPAGQAFYRIQRPFQRRNASSKPGKRRRVTLRPKNQCICFLQKVCNGFSFHFRGLNVKPLSSRRLFVMYGNDPILLLFFNLVHRIIAQLIALVYIHRPCMCTVALRSVLSFSVNSFCQLSVLSVNKLDCPIMCWATSI